MKMLLFDIDGTLLLSGGVGKTAFEKAFEEVFDIPGSWGNTIPDGKTDPIIFEEILKRELTRPYTPDEYRRLFDRYAFYFKQHIHDSPRFRLMPGVPELLEYLMGYDQLLLGIATGNISKVSEMKLNRAGLSHYFRFGGFGCDHGERIRLVETAIGRGEKISGESFANKDIYVIGDAEADIRAAKALGLNMISVATGSTPKETLAELGPDFLFDDLTDKNCFAAALSL
ncbi:MAG: HAD family hydrolase [Candidatus Omnitrophica bacterium]|nr:HAD family hydrolase [Candidatus Omnitrophota bacterium]